MSELKTVKAVETPMNSGLETVMANIEKADAYLKEFPTSKQIWAIRRIAQVAAKKAAIEFPYPKDRFEPQVTGLRAAFTRKEIGDVLGSAKDNPGAALQWLRDHVVPTYGQKANGENPEALPHEGLAFHGMVSNPATGKGSGGLTPEQISEIAVQSALAAVKAALSQ